MFKVREQRAFVFKLLNLIFWHYLQYCLNRITPKESCGVHANDWLCFRIEQLLNKCATAMVSQWNSVNNAFTDRIREYMDAKNKLQTHLSRVSNHQSAFVTQH